MRLCYNSILPQTFGHEYNPFSSEITDIYALVVVYQDAHIDLQLIYNQTAQSLSIDTDSAEYLWLWHHVGFTDIATLERFMLTKTDIVPEMMKHNSISDKWLTGKNKGELTEDVLHYRKDLLCHSKESILALS